jgi:hypothetical protein
MFPWRRIKQDAVEGFRIFREEILAIFNKTLAGTERTKMRWALNQVEAALQERYREVGEKVCQRFIRGEDRITEKDVEGSFREIERLEIERQRILEEIKSREG